MGVTTMFATVVPGLAPVVRRAMAGLPGVVVRDVGFDGRSDVVLFDAAPGRRGAVADLGLTEDIFVEVGRTLRSGGDRPQWIAGRVWEADRVGRALSIWADEVRRLGAAMTYRVIVRVRQERSFPRTELRRRLTEVIGRDRPRWRFGDPAQVEIWLTEYDPGRFVAGLRLSDGGMRQHGGRTVERAGALRPTVASAMVYLAGRPDGILLDPCCGSGTILDEADATAWDVRGVDIDPDAVRATRRNVRDVVADVGDVRRLDVADATVGACVSNLPFGRRYRVPGERVTWLRQALSEMARVTRPGGRVVLLAPDLPRSAVSPGLRQRDRHRIRLLGLDTTIWVFDRRADATG